MAALRTTLVSLQSHPLLFPLPILESGKFWNADCVSQCSEPITRLLWVSAYLSGPSGVLINYDLKGFDVPGVREKA